MLISSNRAVFWRLITIIGVVAFAGCDAISHTSFRVDARESDGSSPTDAVSNVEQIALACGFSFVEEHGSAFHFTDWKAGENPRLWLEVSADRWPMDVHISEMYISRRTTKHKAFVDRLEHSLRENGYRILALSHSDKPRIWPTVLAAFVLAAFLAAWIQRYRIAKENSMNCYSAQKAPS